MGTLRSAGIQPDGSMRYEIQIFVQHPPVCNGVFDKDGLCHPKRPYEWMLTAKSKLPAELWETNTGSYDLYRKGTRIPEKNKEQEKVREEKKEEETEPTAEPTAEPTVEPTVEPTEEETVEKTEEKEANKKEE